MLPLGALKQGSDPYVRNHRIAFKRFNLDSRTTSTPLHPTPPPRRASVFRCSASYLRYRCRRSSSPAHPAPFLPLPLSTLSPLASHAGRLRRFDLMRSNLGFCWSSRTACVAGCGERRLQLQQPFSTHSSLRPASPPQPVNLMQYSALRKWDGL